MLKAVTTERDIGAIHDTLFAQGIWTKSMLKTYLRCPIQFERRYVYGEKEPPGWALGVGIMSDVLLQRWGERELEGKNLPDEEARQILHEQWKAEGLDAMKPRISLAPSAMRRPPSPSGPGEARPRRAGVGLCGRSPTDQESGI
jgi:hypothetical protein